MILAIYYMLAAAFLVYLVIDSGAVWTMLELIGMIVGAYAAFFAASVVVVLAGELLRKSRLSIPAFLVLGLLATFAAGASQAVGVPREVARISVVTILPTVLLVAIAALPDPRYSRTLRRPAVASRRRRGVRGRTPSTPDVSGRPRAGPAPDPRTGRTVTVFVPSDGAPDGRKRRSGAPMDGTPVISSTIRTVGYDERTQTLEIAFHSGHVYRYLDVPGDVRNALLDADSKGRHFHAHIRDRYEHLKVGSWQRVETPQREAPQREAPQREAPGGRRREAGA